MVSPWMPAEGGDLLPDLLGDEGHDGVGQAQQGLQGLDQGAAGAALGGVGTGLAGEGGLGQLQVPVAEMVPGEFVQGLGGLVEAVAADGLVHAGDGGLEAVANPAVGGGELDGAGQAAVLVLGIHEDVTRGVPQLVAEVAVALGAAQVELDVAAGAGQGGEGEAQGIGAEAGDAVGEVGAGGLGDLVRQVGLHHAAGALGDQGLQLDAVDEIDGVEDIALGLGHLVAVGVAHQAVDVNLAEGHIAHELEAHHDHAGHPEEDDVKARDQHRGGVEGLQAFGVLWPAQGGEGPEGGAEPGVQHVRVLRQGEVGGQAVAGADLGLGATHIDVALGVVPGGDAVAPPDLAADAPVLDVAHPLEIGVLPVGGDEADAAVLDGGDGRLRQGLDAHVPLVGEVGLDDGVGTVATGHHELVVAQAGEQPQALQVGDDAPARLVAIQADIGRRDQVALLGGVGADGGVRGQDVDEAAVGLIGDGVLVAMAQPDGVVVEVVGRA